MSFITTMSPTGFDFELTLDPNPRLVSVVRRFVEESFEKLVSDPDAIFRVAMTAHELLENAAKYTATGRATLRVRLDHNHDGVGVHLSLTNQTTQHHLERLCKRIAEIGSSKDPNATFQRMMIESLATVHESGLGLARISAEGEMSLRAEVKDQTVTIFASARIAGGAKV